MYKIVAVDDFQPDLSKLRDMLGSFTDLQLDLLDTCENGVQALESILLNEPDIVICDIEMPFMSGLELCSQVKEKLPGVKFLLCSMYGKFEYAQKAIHLESVGYILKPIDSRELHDMLVKLIKQIQSESQLAMEYETLKNAVRGNQPILTQGFLKELICGFVRHEWECKEKMQYFAIEVPERFSVVLMEIDFTDIEKISLLLDNSADTMELRCVISSKIRELISSSAETSPEFQPVAIDDQHWAVIHGYASSDKDANLAAARFIAGIREAAKTYGISLAFAMSDPGDNIADIHLLYKQCRYIARYKYLFEKGSVITPNDIPADASPSYLDFNEIQSLIKYHMNAGTKEEISVYINSLFQKSYLKNDELAYKNFCFFIIVCIQYVLAENGETFEAVLGDEGNPFKKLMDFSTIMDSKTWITDIALSVHAHINGRTSTKQIAIVESVERYIREHDIRDVSLDSISSNLHYSSHYLNYLYRQHRGKSIFDYICHCKINTAKQLLHGTMLKLYEITEAVGYSHTSYFTSVFKKHVGMTPNEYRLRKHHDA